MPKNTNPKNALSKKNRKTLMMVLLIAVVAYFLYSSHSRTDYVEQITEEEEVDVASSSRYQLMPAGRREEEMSPKVQECIIKQKCMTKLPHEIGKCINKCKQNPSR